MKNKITTSIKGKIIFFIITVLFIWLLIDLLISNIANPVSNVLEIMTYYLLLCAYLIMIIGSFAIAFLASISYNEEKVMIREIIRSRTINFNDITELFIIVNGKSLINDSIKKFNPEQEAMFYDFVERERQDLARSSMKYVKKFYSLELKKITYKFLEMHGLLNDPKDYFSRIEIYSSSGPIISLVPILWDSDGFLKLIDYLRTRYKIKYTPDFTYIVNKLRTT